MPKTFRLAPMSGGIAAITAIMLALAAGLLLAVLGGVPALHLPLGFVIAVYAWIWLRFRPGAFIIHRDAVEIVWPLKRRRIARTRIESVRLIDVAELKQEIGRGMRVGAGGLWGGFGWLWTQRRGIVQMYISRTDHMVWIERGSDRPWLITPERPEEFVRELAR